jgi:hypothetical protein
LAVADYEMLGKADPDQACAIKINGGIPILEYNHNHRSAPSILLPEVEP